MAFADAVALTPIQLVELTPGSIATLANADASNGNKFVARRNSMLRVKNGSGGSITVTLHTNYAVHGLTVPDKTFAVAASADVLFTGFAEIFDQNDDSEVWVTFSSATSVTVQVINPL